MLCLAITAQLPLVETTTRDTLNFPDVVRHLTGKVAHPRGNGPAHLTSGGLYYMLCGKEVGSVSEHLYNKLVMAEATLLMVNLQKPSGLTFKAGEVPVPRSLLLKFMKAVVTSDAKAKELAAGAWRLHAQGGRGVRPPDHGAGQVADRPRADANPQAGVLRIARPHPGRSRADLLRAA